MPQTVAPEAKKESSDNKLKMSATRDLLRYFVQPTEGAHERLGAYIDEMMANDSDISGKADKARGAVKNALMLSLSKVAKEEAQTLLMISQANKGKVPTEQIVASQTALEEEYERVKKFRMRQAS